MIMHDVLTLAIVVKCVGQETHKRFTKKRPANWEGRAREDWSLATCLG